MAMPKARLVIKVEHDDSALDGRGVIVTVKSGEYGIYSEPSRVSLSALSGSELMRVGAYLSQNGYSFGDSRNMDQAQRLSRIVEIVKADGYTAKDFVPKPKSERETLIPKSEPVTPEPIVTPIDSLPESGLVTPSDSHEEVMEKIEAHNATIPEPMPAGNKLAEALAELMPKQIDVPAVKAEIITEALAAVESRLQDVETVRIVISDPLAGIEHELPTLHHRDLPKAIQAVGAGVNVFLTGPAGSGKTMMAEQVARALSKTFHADSFTDDMMRSALYGFIDGYGNYHATELRRALESANDEANAHGSLYLSDELDNARTSIGAGLNMVLSNAEATFPDGVVPIPERPRFAAIASANTWGEGATAEYMGRFPIDVSVRSRFPFRIFVGYDLKMERGAALANATESAHTDVSEWIDYAQGIRRRCDEEKVRLLISPRELIAGARLLSIGMSMTDVKNHTILAGLSRSTLEKIGA